MSQNPVLRLTDSTNLNPFRLIFLIFNGGIITVISLGNCDKSEITGIKCSRAAIGGHNYSTQLLLH